MTDLQIILGKFLGTLALYATMLVVTVLYVALLFWFGESGSGSRSSSGYLGLLLLGGVFLSVGLFISSLTKNQIVAAVATFVTFLMLWVIDWMAADAAERRLGAPLPVDHRSLRGLLEGRCSTRNTSCTT